MTADLTPNDATVDWDAVELVAFDVDGTLYRQRSLRLKMAVALVLDGLRRGDTTVVRVLSAYRRLREEVGDAETEDFETVLVAHTAKAAACGEDRVRAIVRDWIDTRPLPSLRACVYPHVPAVFAALRRRGKRIAVLSDYPAHEKLAAMGLAAELVVSAGDDGVKMLKPNPRGLHKLLADSGVRPGAALLIGDRVERDGMAARRADVPVLIRSSKPIPGWRTFARYDDPVFAGLTGR